MRLIQVRPSPVPGTLPALTRDWVELRDSECLQNERRRGGGEEGRGTPPAARRRAAAPARRNYIGRTYERAIFGRAAFCFGLRRTWGAGPRVLLGGRGRGGGAAPGA